ncbi:MAG: hypothetical protein SGPRY_003592, partial [Prymnesium sp.]
LLARTSAPLWTSECASPPSMRSRRVPAPPGLVHALVSELLPAQPLLRRALSLPEELSAHHWRMIAASLMGVFGSADEPADFGLDEMAATVELLKPMAVDAAAAHALAEARAHQVVVHWVLDRHTSTPVRLHLIELLSTLLHHPIAMSDFLTPENAPVDERMSAEDEVESSEEPTNGNATSASSQPVMESSYRQLMRLFLRPIPVPLLGPLQHICNLVSVWEHATNLRSVSQSALQTDCTTMRDRDVSCEPVLFQLRALNHALHTLTTPSCMVVGSTVDLSSPVADGLATTSCPPAAAAIKSGCEQPTMVATLPPSWSCLKVLEIQLICGAGIWQTVMALLTSGHVRQSSLLQPIAAGLQLLTDLLLLSFGSGYDLTKQPLASCVQSLLTQVAPPVLTRNTSTQSIGTILGSPGVSLARQCDPGKDGDDPADAGEATKADASVKLETPSLPSKQESLSGGREQETDGSWAGQLTLAMRDCAHALLGLDRLIAGQLNALHTLVCLEPAGSVDAVIVALSSDVGVGALGAVLQAALSRSSQTVAEKVSTTARYAATLLHRVLVSVRGAHVSWAHGSWLRDVSRALTAAQPSEALLRQLSAIDRALRPALLMRAHGVSALARCVAQLLLGRPPLALLSSESELNPRQLELPPGSFSRGVSCVSSKANWSQEERDRSGEKTRAAIVKYASSLMSSLRLLRSAATRKEVALALLEADSLAWLRVLLEQGATLLKSCHGETRHGALHECTLLWLLEAAVGIAHAVLWALASSELGEFHDSALFDALCRLSMVLPELPAAAACLTIRASRQEYGAPLPAQRSGSVAEAAVALQKAVLGTIAIFMEGKWPSSLRHVVELSLETPSSSLGALLLLSQALPPPLPISIERLPESLPLRPPTAGPALFCLAPLVGSFTTPSESPGKLEAAEGDSKPPPPAPVPTLPLSVESADHALQAALVERRERWRSLLLESSEELRQFVLSLAGCSCQRVAHVLATLLVRACSLLGVRSATSVVVLPLVQLADQLGRCLADDSAEQPPSAPGDPAIALGRVTLLLAGLAAHPTGRACLLSVEPAVLSSATLPSLRRGAVKPVCNRAGLMMLKYLCDHRVSISSLSQSQTGESISQSLLPSNQLLRPTVAILAELSASVNDSCAPLAKRLYDHVQQVLASSSQPTARRLALAGDGLSADEDDSQLDDWWADESEREKSADDLAAIWPRAWRVFQTDLELETLFESREIFGTGLVETGLEYGLPSEPVSPPPSVFKRPRPPADDDSTTGHAPPPVRGGRGRVRDDVAPRPKVTTSRSTSKHVDEFAGAASAKRFQNSSRAPSKHVDEYQPAPVVRRVAPLEPPSRPAGVGAPIGAPACDGECGEDGDTQSRLPPLPGVQQPIYGGPLAMGGPVGGMGMGRMGVGGFGGGPMLNPQTIGFAGNGMMGMQANNFGQQHMNSMSMGNGPPPGMMGSRPGSMPAQNNMGMGN